MRFTEATGRETSPRLIDQLHSVVSSSQIEAQIRLLDSLRGYRRFLAAMRAQKAENKAASFSLEQTVLNQARQAQRNARLLLWNQLKLVQQLRHTDLLPSTLRALKRSGKIRVAEEAEFALKRKKVRLALANYGFPLSLAEEAVSALKVLNLEAWTDGGILFGSAQKREVSLRIDEPLALSADGVQPTIRVSELLRHSVFDATVAGFERGDVPIVGFAESQGSTAPLNYYDVVAFCAVLSMHEIDRHVRKLEDTGALDIHRGQDPATLITIALVALIAAGVLATVGLVFSILCSETHDIDACRALNFFLGLAEIAFGIGVAAFSGLLPGIGWQLGLIASAKIIDLGIETIPPI
jgi:hypothetical protein